MLHFHIDNILFFLLYIYITYISHVPINIVVSANHQLFRRGAIKDALMHNFVNFYDFVTKFLNPTKIMFVLILVIKNLVNNEK